MAQNSPFDLGAGLDLLKTLGRGGGGMPQHPSGPPQHGQMSQAERAISAGSSLLSGAMAITATQVMGAPLKLINEEYYNHYMAFTKQAFAVLITTITNWWSPTVVRVSADASMRGQLSQDEKGDLRCHFPHRIVLMANHQLYTDWLYLWWIAYTNGMHGYIYIILKESIKNIPIFGWSAQFYNFIFLSRKWEKDKSRFKEHLDKLNKPREPMWLLIFPEGTNLSKSTRERSKEWAEKNGLEDMKHQLLPRSTGLHFCLEELKGTTEWLYDCTIAYEGVPEGQFGQDIFTLRSSFFEGRPPKSVNMHWRRFKIADIPLENPKAFEVWLRNRWREKDYMLEFYARTGRFPAEEFWKVQGPRRKEPGKAKYIETEVKSGSWEEFLSLFAPITALISVLFLFYSDPSKLLQGGGPGAPSEAGESTMQSAMLKEMQAATAAGATAMPSGKKKPTASSSSSSDAGPVYKNLTSAQKASIKRQVAGGAPPKAKVQAKVQAASLPKIEPKVPVTKQMAAAAKPARVQASSAAGKKPQVATADAKKAANAISGGKASSVTASKKPGATGGAKSVASLPNRARPGSAMGSVASLPVGASAANFVPARQAAKDTALKKAAAGMGPQKAAEGKPAAATKAPTKTSTAAPKPQKQPESAAPPSIKVDKKLLDKMVPKKGEEFMKIDPETLKKIQAGMKK
ncbi:hypothetical protein H2201_005926 [Coniosporium apollinis]|uniref:Phospholipid/glycerol acyltransferase domain-containing protein n=1 Tax=Coniosporium apollinis TaxID=61459 RepID=A0ABQ9NTT0_9PEZI|nr:hypothetical protein H2201_005926 [Coniosporium apollinis]